MKRKLIMSLALSLMVLMSGATAAYADTAPNVPKNDKVSITKPVTVKGQKAPRSNGFKFQVVSWKGDWLRIKIINNNGSKMTGVCAVTDILMDMEVSDFDFSIPAFSNSGNLDVWTGSAKNGVILTFFEEISGVPTEHHSEPVYR